MLKSLIAPDLAQGIINNRATMFSVPVKVQPPEGDYRLCSVRESMRRGQEGKLFWQLFNEQLPVLGKETESFPLPYPVGCIVYLRETWMYSDVEATWDDEEPSRAQILYKASNDMRPDGVSPEDFGAARWINVSHETAEDIESKIEQFEQFGERWQSPATMPREAARIFIEITAVKVQRVQDVSEEEAVQHGLNSCTKDGNLYKWGLPDTDGLPGGYDDNTGWAWKDYQKDHTDTMRKLLKAESNPFLFTYTFRVLSTTGKPENVEI